MWYSSVLNSMKVGSSKQTYYQKVQCICGNTSRKEIVHCIDCGKYQHSKCLGFNNNYHGKYRCPQCWVEQPLIESGATLIVTPISLRTQWCNEICKHIKGNLKILQYQGYSAMPIYPTQFKQYDIVITTYNVLQSEFKLTETLELTHSFRRQRKYSPPGSSITRIKWWRLCLDEAQTVETPGRIVSAMAQKIEAHYRWAVTGTPVSKSVSDLYGLIDYLQITPYNEYTTWKNILLDPYEKGDYKPMCKFLSEVMWRTSKSSVLDQIEIPQQTFEEHLLEFSAVEKYFYRKEHELSCSEFLDKLKNYNSSSLLQRLDKKSLKNILAPLLALRQACTHPNTIRGRYLATKKQVTSMKELLQALILKNTTESEECLRFVISSLNGLGGIFLLLQNPGEAVNQYRKVLQLYARFTKEEKQITLNVDKLQIIHTMHNLAETLEIFPQINHTLRDDTLKVDCLEMEKKYIEKFINQTVSTFNETLKYSGIVSKLLGKFILRQGQWYSDGLDWTGMNDHFTDLKGRIQTACDNANVTCNVMNESDPHILYLLYNWDDQLWDLRQNCIDTVNKLYHHNPDEEYKIIIEKQLVTEAMDCHLRPQKNSKKKKCSVCMANAALKNYEFKLFTISKRKTDFEEMSLLGSWKPCLEELIVKSLVALLKAKNAEDNLIKDGEVHIQLIESLKKEFKEIRKLWTYLDQQICAQDELDICKIRLRLRDPTKDKENNPKEKNQILKNLSYVMESKLENVHLLSEIEVEYQRNVLQGEEIKYMSKLESSLGTQSYLDTLRKQQYEGQNPDPCPICKNALEKHWSILLCGHSYCIECVHHLLEQTTGKHFLCSICRNRQDVNEISYIKAGSGVTKEDESSINGNYSTKIEAVVKLVMQLKSSDPEIKVLLFSSWMPVLKNIKEALEVNKISSELLVSHTLEKKIESFKDPEKDITVLLLPVHLGSKGLNLVEATHVILVEPLLNPADELQAIGRVHRIGQTKPTVVHRFLIKNTIEESIHKATTSDADNWDKNKVTLGQLSNLFMNTEITSQTLNETIEEGDIEMN